MPYFQLNNSQCYYEVNGCGEPILYLHGWNGNMSGFQQNLMPHLQDRYQCITVDFPGFGRSEAAEVSFDDLSDGIEKLLDHLRIQAVTLLGFCMGGVVALDYAMRRQNRIKKLILVETYADFPVFLLPLLSNRFGRRMFEFGVNHPIGIRLVKRYLLLRDFLYREDFFKTFQTVDPKTSLKYVRMFWDYARKVDHYERMKDLDLKTLLIMGEQTNGFVKRSICRIQKILPDSRLEILEASGHFPIEENSLQLAQSLKQFLE